MILQSDQNKATQHRLLKSATEKQANDNQMPGQKP